MANFQVKVDGFDLGQIGLIIEETPGWRNGLEESYPTQSVPDSIGVRRLSDERTSGVRNLTLRGHQRAQDVATLLDRRDELLWRISGKDLEVVLPDRNDRSFFCRVDGRPNFERIRPAFTQTAHLVRIPTVLEDPRIYSSSESSLSIASDDASPTDVPLGTAPTPGVFDVDQTAFTLIYRDSGGTEQARLEVSGASTTPVTVDMDAMTIETSNGGEIETLVGSTDFFDFDPRDGDFAASNWPQIEVVSGTANVATATVTYRKAWA